MGEIQTRWVNTPLDELQLEVYHLTCNLTTLMILDLNHSIPTLDISRHAAVIWQSMGN